MTEQNFDILFDIFRLGGIHTSGHNA